MKKIVITIIATTLLYADTGTLIKIVDGDTVHFQTNDKVVNCRLAYIDTPESKRNNKAKKDIANCGSVNLDDVVNAGKQSSYYLAKYLKTKQTYHYTIVDKDTRYNRAVCEIYIKDRNLLNLQIVSDGYALPYYSYIKDNNTKNIFKQAVKSAQESNNGLWETNTNVMQCLDNQEINNNKFSFEDFIDKAITIYNKFSKFI